MPQPRTGKIVVVGLPLPPDVALTAIRDIEYGTERYWALLRARASCSPNISFCPASADRSDVVCPAVGWRCFSPSRSRGRGGAGRCHGRHGLRGLRRACRRCRPEKLGELVRSFNHMATDLETSRSSAGNVHRSSFPRQYRASKSGGANWRPFWKPFPAAWPRSTAICGSAGQSRVLRDAGSSRRAVALKASRFNLCFRRNPPTKLDAVMRRSHACARHPPKLKRTAPRAPCI